MVLINDEIVKKLHLLDTTKKVSKKMQNIVDSHSSFSMNFILGGIISIILIMCYFIINKPSEDNQNKK